MASRGLIVRAAAFSMSLVAAFFSFGQASGEALRGKRPEQDIGIARRDYTGLWVTADGHIRHELLPNGRYVEARGTREKAYQGRYWIEGTHIAYEDDTGFSADGDFKDGILYHAGMILYRQAAPAATI